jgi:hypothetical protein
MTRRTLVRAAVAVAGVTTLASPAAAHAGSLGGALQSAPIPFWLVVGSGGGVVGVSFLLTSLLTDHDLIRGLNGRRVGVPSPSAGRAVAVPLLRAVGVFGLLVVVGFAFGGPPDALGNLAVLVVWVGWWAGYTMSAYLLADTWPLVNPWRTLADVARTVTPTRRFPERVGAWPSVAGLLLLVWVEVVSPVSTDPRTLGAVVAGYSAVTVVGAATYGDVWFENVDPVARVFRQYGRLAPVQRTPDGLSLAAPGTALARDAEAATAADVAFVVALLWVTTYDGLVSTVAGNDLVRAASRAGVPPWVSHLLTVAVGFLAVLGTYYLAARLARRTADSYVTGRYVAGWFAPALLPIAAGYHLAHFLGYFLGFAPALATVALDPVSPPPTVPTLVAPAWFGGVQLAAVVVGHLVAVWVSHARAFELFPGRLHPVRSQYPFVVVMVLYTMTSLWIVSQPFATPLT